MRNLAMFLLFIFLFSCQQKQDKNTSVKTTDSILTEKNQEVIKEINEQKGDTIFMNFKDEKGLYAAEGIIDSIRSKVYVKFQNEEIGKLNAKIIPTTGKGNIRFNQIIFPDKTMDGPFGMDLKIDLQQKGNYILIIGHSQMADNPFWGKFKVELENKRE